MLINKFLSNNKTLIGSLYFSNKNNNFYQQIIKADFHKYYELFKLGEYYKGYFFYEVKKGKNINKIESRLEIKSNSLDCERLYLVETIKLQDIRGYDSYDYRLGWQTRLTFNSISFNKVPVSIKDLISKKSDNDIITCSVNK